MDIDTEDGIRAYLARGIDGLYELARERSEAGPPSLRAWVLKNVGVYLSGGMGGWGSMSKVCGLVGEAPDTDIFEFSKEVCEGLMLSTSPYRMPKSNDECAICGKRWSLATFADSAPQHDGNMVHESCRVAKVQQAQIDALTCAGCAVSVESGKVVGRARGWVFCKGSNPSYWRANTDSPLPQKAALWIHNWPWEEDKARGRYSQCTGVLGDAVRYEGHCGSPAPDGPAACYHIDSDEALSTFVTLLALRAVDGPA